MRASGSNCQHACQHTQHNALTSTTTPSHTHTHTHSRTHAHAHHNTLRRPTYYPTHFTHTHTHTHTHGPRLQVTEISRKKRRTGGKSAVRSLVGASLEVINKKRNEKSEVRQASRECVCGGGGTGRGTWAYFINIKNLKCINYNNTVPDRVIILH